MWFDSWSDVVRVVLVGPATYLLLVVSLRASGKRTLSKLNSFDFIVTVALGSTLATILLSRDVALVEGVTALTLLIVLQYVVAWATVRNRWTRTVVKSRPTLVVRRGELLHDALRRERLAVGEVHQALRGSGISDLAAVAAVVLETDGSLSVISDAVGAGAALADVDGW